MQVKTDTKEKFHVITVIEPALSATMTEEMGQSLLAYLQNDVKNVVLVLSEVKTVEPLAAQKLVNIQQKFYESDSSFVVCELQQPVEDWLDQHGFLELMNVTPTQSEAGDIVQMEEIEREIGL